MHFSQIVSVIKESLVKREKRFSGNNFPAPLYIYEFSCFFFFNLKATRLEILALDDILFTNAVRDGCVSRISSVLRWRELRAPFDSALAAFPSRAIDGS